MLRTRHGQETSRRPALMAVQVAVLLPVLIGCAALTIDVGAMYNAKAELQRTADAVALAAAARLSAFSEGDPQELALAAAVQYAESNTLFGQPIRLDPSVDVVFGRANYDEDATEYNFTPTTVVPDAIRITVRFSSDSPNGPLPLYFAGLFGKRATDVTAEAIAMMVPRDIAIVADLSGSMNDDSELQNVHDQPVNTFDVWAALPIEKGNAGVGNGIDPPPPGNPHSENDQPGTGPGSPANAGGNPNPGAEPFNDDEPHGPRWGWMTGWGDELVPVVYDPTADLGLYYIPRYQTTTDADVIENLTQAGYSSAERSALLSSTYDSTTTYYRNRVKVMLGLAGWRSKKSGSKYNGGPGNGNDRVESNEVWQELDYQFDSGTWDTFIDYARGTSQMTSGDSDFQYHYGIKTFVNYLLEQKESNSETPELAGTPAQPVQAVKDAVEHMVEVIQELETDDLVSLEIYGQTVHHEHDLTDEYQEPLDRLMEMQAGHYDAWTNMGGGIYQGIQELTASGRQRSTSRKVMILLTDGQANVDEYGNTGDYEGGKEYALAMAQAAADAGIRIFTVSHGYGSDQDLMEQIAEIGSGQHYHAEGSIDDYSSELDEIFETLGGTRPVELIR